MSILSSVDQIVELFESSQCKYVVIGGIAVLLHGGRASTLDFDLYILASDFSNLESYLVGHGAKLEIKADHQLRLSFGGVQIDVLEADPVLGKTIFKRSIRRKIVNSSCNVATHEDLIILKTLADRPIDRRDVAELREIFEGNIDEAYVSQMLSQFH